MNSFTKQLSDNYKKRLVNSQNIQNLNNSFNKEEQIIQNNIKNQTNKKITLPGKIKSSKYLIKYITLILELRNINIESFDDISNKNSIKTITDNPKQLDEKLKKVNFFLKKIRPMILML